MPECPIGLICEYFDCDRTYCQNLAAPWPLPYWLNTVWHNEKCLEVSLINYDYDECPNVEHLIIEQENYNALVERLRIEYWLGGWWDGVELPYQPHPDGGLEVMHHLLLKEEVTFSHPWKYDSQHKYDISPTYWESFMPSVPVDGGYQTHLFADIEADGFYSDCWLLYPRDFYGNGYEE